MRLTCEVELVNRLLPSFNLKKAGRGCRAQVSLGKKPASSSKDGALFLMVCTAKDRNGMKFPVSIMTSHTDGAVFMKLSFINTKYTYLIFM